MGLQTALVANILFPLQEKLKKHDTVAIRQAMDNSQWWPAEKLEDLRLERLRTLLTKVGKHVPYYRDCFKNLGFDPQKIQSLADLQKLPLLTKSIIRTEGDRMKSDIAQGLARFNTGGSSGEPLIFSSAPSASATTSRQNGEPPVGGTSTSAIRKLLSGDHRSNWAPRTEFVPSVTN